MPAINHPLIDVALKEGVERFSAKVLLPHPEKNQVLMIRRAPTEKRAGQWDFPGGGADCLGDSQFECLEIAAKREVKEEVGEDVAVTSLKYLDFYNDYTSSKNKKVRIFYFIATEWQGTPQLPLNAEHDRMAWITPKLGDDIYDHLKQSYRQALEHWQRFQ